MANREMPNRVAGAGSVALGELLADFGDVAKSAFTSGLAKRKAGVDR